VVPIVDEAAEVTWEMSRRVSDAKYAVLGFLESRTKESLGSVAQKTIGSAGSAKSIGRAMSRG
jgi:hypothetical protein